MVYLALCVSVFFSTLASEMFAGTRLHIHETYCLRQADVALCHGPAQLTAAHRSTADRVEVRLRGSKDGQMRKGAVVSRARAGPPSPVEANGGAVDLMIELMSCYLFLSSWAWLHTALVKTDVVCGRRSKRRQLCEK